MKRNIARSILYPFPLGDVASNGGSRHGPTIPRHRHRDDL